jgi:hypothetical protein
MPGLDLFDRDSAAFGADPIAGQAVCACTRSRVTRYFAASFRMTPAVVDRALYAGFFASLTAITRPSTIANGLTLLLGTESVVRARVGVAERGR